MSDVLIEKVENGIKIKGTCTSPSNIVLKAQINSVCEYDFPETVAGESYELVIPYPNEFWTKAVIKGFILPIPVEISDFIAKAKLRTGEHHTPPKGKPAKRSLYAVPEKYVFPLDTPGRVHSAMGYFNRHRFANPAEKKRAASRIIRAAKKFGIKVEDDSNVYRAAHGGKVPVKRVTWSTKKK